MTWKQGVSKGEWVRRALEDALANDKRGLDPLARLSSLGAPTADIFLARVQGGGLEGCTCTEVLHEILYRYVGLRRPDLAVEVHERLSLD